MFDFSLIPAEYLEFVRYGAITGFIATTALIINFNHKIFDQIFHERAKSYWWLFVLSGVVPMVSFLYVFTVIFGHL